MAHMCVHCSFNGERGKCERVGAHHAPYCPRFKGTCKYCGCKGGFECVAKEHGHHQSFCPRFRGECKLCGIKGSYEEIAMLSPAHNRFCERYSNRCHFCGVVDGAVCGGHHQVRCSRFRGECKHCHVVGSCCSCSCSLGTSCVSELCHHPRPTAHRGMSTALGLTAQLRAVESQPRGVTLRAWFVTVIQLVATASNLRAMWRCENYDESVQVLVSEDVSNEIESTKALVFDSHQTASV
ncbi:unnamed protein product [Durusdinium trenchii]|uniref:Uncharacterized protein n=2 Tax=Durusdinium trenchii TaxID=1381693 RepID=A0ABP0J764_9DINO